MGVGSLRVGTRLALGFIALLMLCAVLVAIGVNSTAKLQRNLDSIVETDFAWISLVNVMRDAVRFQAIALRDVVGQQDLAFKRQELILMKSARKQYLNAGESLTSQAKSGNDHALIEMMERHAALDESVFVHISNTIELSLEDKHDAAQSMVFTHVRPAQLELIASLAKLETYLKERAVRSAQAAAQENHRAVKQLITGGGLAVVFGILIATAITRSITVPLRIVVATANRIGQGDLSDVPQARGNDEVAQLVRAIGTMRHGLATLIGNVQSASGTVSKQAESIYGVTETVTGVVLGQTNRLTSTSASTQELSATIGSVYEGAGGVLKAAETTRELIVQSQAAFASVGEASSRITETVTTSSQAMEELAGAIEGVTAVTKVIREIAEQTNLLALNAAIEAARAGDQGRGFAVVADEVRVLSHRTAASTSDIAKMVDTVKNKSLGVVESMKKVTAEVTSARGLNAQAAQCVSQIVDTASRVTDLAQEIVSISQDQTQAAERMANDILHISNDAGKAQEQFKQLEASAGHLKITSETLHQQVSRFNLTTAN